MSMNNTPGGERVHIGIFGLRNAGKSSLMNAITGQSMALVSPTPGTTTDPVSKALELLPLGPVLLTDTPGLDDEGELGQMRVERSYEVLRKCDIALLVLDGDIGISELDRLFLSELQKRGIPWLAVINEKKRPVNMPDFLIAPIDNALLVNAKSGEGVHELKGRLAAIDLSSKKAVPIVSDLLKRGDFAVLVVPVDESAPKGRLILPQQQTIRDILDCAGVAITAKPGELSGVLSGLKKEPKIVITDSQVFKEVSAIVPENIPLTSFSILFARHKGILEQSVLGVAALKKIQDGDKILVSEGCTHHRQCGDIGSVKIPKWIEDYTGKKPSFAFTSGGEFPKDLSPFSLIVHCGGCMLNEKEMAFRMGEATDGHVPMTNYGILIAEVQGILRRTISPFPQIRDMLK